MKKTILLALSLCIFAFGANASEVNYTHSAELSNDVTHVKLFDANYAYVATKTETRTIPGCIPNRKNGETCTEVVVVESQPVVQANVYYEDGMQSGKNGQNHKFVTLNFKLSDFSEEQVATLIAAYPTWKHPFSNAPKRFAANNLELTQSEERREIQIVDAAQSRFCRRNKNGDIIPNCVEHIVYKTSYKNVLEVNVSVK